MNRERLTQHEKQQGFKKAFSTFAQYRSAGSYLSAYVVAFSIFEDRLTACYMLAKDAAAQQRPQDHKGVHQKVNYLNSKGYLNHASATEWKLEGNERNRLLHDAMWTIDAISDVDCERAHRCARAADRLARTMKKSPPRPAVDRKSE